MKKLVVLSMALILVLGMASFAFAADKHILLIAKGDQVNLLEEYLKSDSSLQVSIATEGNLFDTDSELFTAEAMSSYDGFIIGELVLGAGANGSLVMEVDLQERIAEAVQAGAGLAMIGGWCSYQGGMEDWSGQWQGTPIDTALPVTISADWDTNDDGASVPQLDLPNHPIVAGLDWASVERFGGFNMLAPEENATVVLSDPASGYPLIVVGNYGAGKTVAYAGGLAGGWDEDFISWVDFPKMWLQLARYLVD